MTEPNWVFVGKTSIRLNVGYENISPPKIQPQPSSVQILVGTQQNSISTTELAGALIFGLASSYYVATHGRR